MGDQLVARGARGIRHLYCVLRTYYCESRAVGTRGQRLSLRVGHAKVGCECHQYDKYHGEKGHHDGNGAVFAATPLYRYSHWNTPVAVKVAELGGTSGTGDTAG